MASKGPRSKLDHETRARRQKALEVPREPRRPKAHWDHVMEEMVWLSKDFESERKWKLALAKKVALRASKGMLDQATKGERRVKEEEQRLRKVALSISKDMKKFWTKIEKLVLYKHQLELEDKKKKALDKQLEFLLGQTERYSTMLAENLVDAPTPCTLVRPNVAQERVNIQYGEDNRKDTRDYIEPHLDPVDSDDDYDVQSEDDAEDDEHTVDEDEAHITEEERREELAALKSDVDLPLDELLKHYTVEEVSRENSPLMGEDRTRAADAGNAGMENSVHADHDFENSAVTGRRCMEVNGALSDSEKHLSSVESDEDVSLSKGDEESVEESARYDISDDQEDGDFDLSAGEEKDDETTLSEEEKLAKAESNDSADEISMLQKDNEISVEELLARYQRDCNNDEVAEDDSRYASACSDELSDSEFHDDIELKSQAGTKDENDNSCKFKSVSFPTDEQEAETQCRSIDGNEGESKIADAAAAARSAQPTGNTFSTTKVRTKFPFLVKYPLREYQHIGLDWLVTMYEKRLNGILADEMGLGKTIMTIALLAHLACEKGIWGPHLIVVPTSVMLNWETEFLKWCPAFKILTYFGTAKERKMKRQGWLKPNYFHVCITTYRLVIQDSKVFKRKKWKYLILDEAHLIKNWKSQRWQTLLNFNSKRRILLTGTPLQNDLMELWSLMHFLMPHIFQSHQEFKDWFSNPISGMVEGQEKINKEVVDRLHNVLRPFILRRLKRDVEKQLPMKYEHVIYCRLSRRQRNLYEDFIASSETQATLASANFFGMISVIMQLRKVCNHPDLFEGRPIVSSYDMGGIEIQLSSSVCSMLSPVLYAVADLRGLGFLFTHHDFSMTSWESDEVKAIATSQSLIKDRVVMDEVVGSRSLFVSHGHQQRSHGPNIFQEIHKAILEERLRQAKERAASIAWWNSLRCEKKPIYSTTMRELVTVKHPVYDIHRRGGLSSHFNSSSVLAGLVLSPVERFRKMIEQVEHFMFAIPAARAPQPSCWCSRPGSPVFLQPAYEEKCSEILLPLLSPIRPAIVRRQVYFPDRRLIQFDCGKLQELAVLLRRLKSEGHRALIFTQMTKMLDILEVFINLYGYTYMRLDGSTQPETRQTLMQRFNTNPKIFLFILSTRSGGVGINLVGADTVIFYDSDWNPAMDQQAQDRCHRIGQTREVHIYRLISESTIEENILKKANQKRALDDLVIQGGSYNTEFFKKLDPMELFSGHRALHITNAQHDGNTNDGVENSLSNADVEAALKNVEDEADYMALKKVEEEEAVDNQEFTEETIGRMDDDELVNEDELKGDDPADQGGWLSTSNKESGSTTSHRVGPNEEGVLALTKKEDEIDMLADVRQMAAAAAASGQAVLSFEDQLRPIDRYAVRFLELWDPVIDKAAIESEVGFQETEWELDRIEKLKEDMEAEIDEDEEPLVYERWDAEFATEAYRQHVEALAQHQLLEELESEAREMDADGENYDSIKDDISADPKPKLKKKPKKAKFKSLKKGPLASEPRNIKEELHPEPMSTDDEAIFYEDYSSLDMVSPQSDFLKKRKKWEAEADEDYNLAKKSKKLKKVVPGFVSSLSGKQFGESKELKSSESAVVDVELKQASRSRFGGKISITPMPIKRVLTIKPEKLRRKGSIWSKDCFPLPDAWLSREDAILCAVVHEYGPNWSLVSDVLYGMTAGGFYRGRYRHPVHCCERFRELAQKYVFSTSDHLNHEKVGSAFSGKALLKVTEDNIHTLLDVASELPDSELLLQKHFTALLSSVWRVTSRVVCQQSVSSTPNFFSCGGRRFRGNVHLTRRNFGEEPRDNMDFCTLGQGSKLLAAALDDVDMKRWENKVSQPNEMEELQAMPEQMELTIEIQRESDDSTTPFPSAINLVIIGSDTTLYVDKPVGDNRLLKSSQCTAENRFREASRACIEGSTGWASSAFPTCDIKSRSASKSQFLGKHKLSASDSTLKPSKSKLKKAAVEPSDMPPLLNEPLFQQRPTVAPNDPNLRFDLTPSYNPDVFDECDLLPDVDEAPLEPDNRTLAPHHYAAGFITGLDDCVLSQEYVDFG